MARTRKYTVQYGGGIAGTGNPVSGGVYLNPLYSGLHQCADETHPGPPYRKGGPLVITKTRYLIHKFPPLDSFYHATLGCFSGRMGIYPYIPGSVPGAMSLSGWGARGWSRTQPLHPVYQLGVSIAELKDLPRLLTQTKYFFSLMTRPPKETLLGARTVREFLSRLSKVPKDTGDAYLAGAFGLAPLFQDLAFLSEMTKKLRKKIDWLRKHNGKAVRRKVTLDAGGFSENIGGTSTPGGQCWPTLATQLYGAGALVNGNMLITKKYNRRVWYSAKYRYFIPELSKNQLSWPKGLVADLLGLAPDPVIIYKLTPWSWMLDWFTSVGSAISNIYARAKYHVVAEYAYVMCSEEYTYGRAVTLTMNQGKRVFGVWDKPQRTDSGVSLTVYEHKRREVANPYGFGITFSSLTGYQWSILAALGLSRVRSTGV